MEDLKHLNHYFNKCSYNDFIFICEKCNISIWKSGITDDFNYWIIDENYLSTGILLKLTCEETIIKKLLE